MPKFRNLFLYGAILVFALICAGSASAQAESGVRVISLSNSGFEQANSLAFSTDGKFLAVGGTSGIYIFDPQQLSTPNFIQTNNWARSVAFLPGSDTLAAGLFDKTIKFWSLPANQLTKTLDGPQGWVRSIAFSGDGNLITGISDDNTVRVWNVADGSLILNIKDMTGVRAVAFSPDGKLVAAALGDKSVRVWRVPEGDLLYTLAGHTDWVRCLAFSPDGQTLASGSFDKTVRLWNMTDGALSKTLKGHASSVLGIAFSPDGTILASGSVDETVRLWQVSTGQALRVLAGHSDFVYSVAFSPDGKTLASGSSDNTIRLWNIQKFINEQGASAAKDAELLPATPSDCQACHHSRGQGEPPRVILLRCEGCHQNGASLQWCPAFNRSPEAVTPPISFKAYTSLSGVPVGGKNLAVLIATPSNGETLYARDGITAPVYVVGQVHSNQAKVTDLQIMLTIWSGSEKTSTLTTQPSPTGQFKFNLSLNPQGAIPYIIKPGGADCVPCHEDYRAQAPIPNGDVRLSVTVTDPDGQQVSDERWVKVDASGVASLPVQVVDDVTHQPLPGISVLAKTVLYEWRSRFGNALTNKDGIASLNLNQLTQAPTLYDVSIPPTAYQGKLYTSEQPVTVTLNPGITTNSPVILTVHAQNGQLDGNLTSMGQLVKLPGEKIWAVLLPAGPAYEGTLDEQNKFSFNQIPVGQYTVMPDPFSLSEKAISAAAQNIDLIQSPKSEVTFTVTKSHPLRGKVTSSNGEPVHFAWTRAGDHGKIRPIDPNTGSFLIPDVLSDVKYLTISAPGYYSQTKKIDQSVNSIDFQLISRPETQVVKWGDGSVTIPPETSASINEKEISLEQGWLWGSSSNSQPLIVKMAGGLQLEISTGDFALQNPVGETSWLYIKSGGAKIQFDNGQPPVILASGQMIALISSVQPLPINQAVVMALHPALTNTPIFEIIEPTILNRVQDWLQTAGIEIAQSITFITYFLSLVALFLIPIIVVFLVWKKRKESNSNKENH